MEFDFEKNFWKQNNYVLLLDYFVDIYNKDKSADKSDSSKLLWAVAYCAHPKSPIFPVHNKWEQVKKSILSNAKHNWESKENKKLVDEFKNVILSVPEKSYLFWCEHMSKREDFVRSIDYMKEEDLKRIDLAEDMAAKTPKLYVELARIKEQLDVDSKSGKDNKNKSLADQGQI